MQVLKKRADFLAANGGRRAHVDGFTLQGRARGDEAPPRFGFTCSKKVGNAVARNRAKRRLREVARLAILPHARAGWDYVLIGRPVVTGARPWPDMLGDAARALAGVHDPANAPRGTARRPAGPRRG